MSENTKNPLMAPEKPKKRHLWGLWIPLIVIFSLVVVPVGIVAVLFYDAHTVNTGIKGEPTDNGKIFGSIMTDMFDGCRKEANPTIDIKITQNDLNQLLYNATYSATSKDDSPLKQFSLEIKEDGKYVFDLEISTLYVVKTHFVIEATVRDSRELPNGDKGFLFDITNMKVGRLSGLQGVLPWLTSTTGVDISTIFSSAGLHIVFDVDNLRLTYSYDDFVSDLADMSKVTEPLFLTIFQNFFTKELVDFSHNPDSDVTGVIQMSPYTINDAYSNEDFRINKKFGEEGNIPMHTYFASVAENLIDLGVIENDANVTAHVSALIKFLSYGQNYLNDGEQAYIASIYENSIKSLKSNYCGDLDMEAFSIQRKNEVIGSTSAGLMDAITGEINTKLAEPGFKSQMYYNVSHGSDAYLFDSDNPYTVDDSSVHTMLKGNKKLLGYGFSFVGENANGGAKVSYTILDNVYPTLIEGKSGAKDTMALTFGLNVNGTETVLVMPMEANEIHQGDKHGFTFSIKDAPLYYGNSVFENLKDQLQEDVINKVGSSSDDDNMIQFVQNPETQDVEEIKMIFDFDDYFSKEAAKPEEEQSEFYKLHALAIDNGAELSVDFVFKSLDADPTHPNNHRGYFEVVLGYEGSSLSV